MNKTNRAQCLRVTGNVLAQALGVNDKVTVRPSFISLTPGGVHAMMQTALLGTQRKLSAWRHTCSN